VIDGSELARYVAGLPESQRAEVFVDSRPGTGFPES